MPAPESIFAHDRRGQRLIWIRPDNPSVALQLARTALNVQDAALFQALPQMVQKAGGSYTFVGGVSADHQRVLDEDGRDIGAPQPGDSIVAIDTVDKES